MALSSAALATDVKEQQMTGTVVECPLGYLTIENSKKEQSMFNRGELRDQRYQAFLGLADLLDLVDNRSPQMITLRNIVIHRHPVTYFRLLVFYQSYERFVEVAELLQARYGTALRDLIPTKVSELYLYGDALDSPRVVAAARERIFRLDTR